MVIYDIYNSDTLEQLTDAVQKCMTKQPGMKNFASLPWSWPLCYKFSFIFNNDKRKICQNV